MIDATDNLLSLTVAQYRAIAGTSTHSRHGFVTIADTGATSLA